MLVRVDFARKRNVKRTKKLFRDAVELVDGVGPIAGFALVVWDDSGRAGASFVSGGPVAPGAVPLFAHARLERIVSTIV